MGQETNESFKYPFQYARGGATGYSSKREGRDCASHEHRVNRVKPGLSMSA